MNASGFFYETFISGWSKPESYNVFDTMAYAVLAIVLISLIFKLLKSRAKFDYKLLLNIIPFIILGSLVRVYADTGIYERFFWTVTPGIWLLMAALFLLSFFLDKLLKKKIIVNYLPVILILFHLPFFKIINPKAMLYYSAFFLLSIIPFFFLRKKAGFLRNNLAFFALASHLFDATSTFVNIDFYGYREVHLVGAFFTEILNTGFAMYPLKLAVLLPLLYYLHKDKDKEFSNYLMMIICVLGLGPGIRNFISILLGV
ncbi:MAG: DUF63 family protein [Candidatus Nanoarchaeia archaeon]|nr:DUF63 family protein [Candidatus Nanoarchaeia archaeon]MDD5054096.1 DUF63 family protein [Candidatus Nanoarchaeia archaeon]MDD5499534.1 DUF63 family protein [Candidatus Nanoarchaeia archaeon]